jgi:valyl-tRNA synthetase
MKGRKVFYPMGFDDNGLPTERFVEKTYKINKRNTSRKKFRELCLQVTRQGIEEYERVWRALGLSVDWNLRYSTIDDHCTRPVSYSTVFSGTCSAMITLK